MEFQLIWFSDGSPKMEQYYTTVQNGLTAALNQAKIEGYFDAYEASEDSKTKYNVTQYPTFIVIDSSNNKALRLSGYQTQANIQRYFYQYFAGLPTSTDGGSTGADGSGGNGNGNGCFLGICIPREVWLWIGIGSGALAVTNDKTGKQVLWGSVAGLALYKYFSSDTTVKKKVAI